MTIPKEQRIGINSNTEIPHQTHGSFLCDLYTDAVKNADNKILDYFKKNVSGTQSIFGIHVASYVIFFVLVIILQVYGLKRVFENQGDIFGISVSLIGLLALFIIVYRNPMKELNRSLLDLTKNHIIFLGYIREIYQVDISFMQYLLEESSDSKRQEKFLQNVQNIIDSYIESLTSLDDV